MTKLSSVDKALEVSTLLVLAGVWIYLAFVYPDLPSVIPTHFDLGGRADDYGSKNTLWILPVVATAVYIGLTLLSRIPHKFNYPVTVTPGNAERLYQTTVRLLRMIRFLVVMVLSSLVCLVCTGVKEGHFNLGAWFAPAVVGLFMLTVCIYLVSVTKRT